jgi:cytochrome c oxidase subunit III
MRSVMAHASKREVNAAVGLMVFLGAVAMIFAALLFAYAVLRAQAPVWPPPEAGPFPRAAAGANGLLLLGAGLALRRARSSLGASSVPGWPAAALVLGLAFLVLQARLWSQLVAARLGPGAGTLGDVFFALSGFHALHVAGGLVALALSLAPERGRRLRLVSLYWDFVFVVWLVFFLAVCVL